MKHFFPLARIAGPKMEMRVFDDITQYGIGGLNSLSMHLGDLLEHMKIIDALRDAGYMIDTHTGQVIDRSVSDLCDEDEEEAKDHPLARLVFHMRAADSLIRQMADMRPFIQEMTEKSYRVYKKEDVDDLYP